MSFESHVLDAGNEPGGLSDRNESLLNVPYVRQVVTADDPWCSAHGAARDSHQLGAGLLYYALAAAFRAQVCMCLGSGGGFVPRLMRQAQRDLDMYDARTILVDGCASVPSHKVEIWGSPSWLGGESSFRANYPDIEIVQELTEVAYEYFVADGVSVDYLHIDADHHYEGVKQDWELYRNLLSPGAVVTFHDTVNTREPCGVPRLIDELTQDPDLSVVNLPIAFGTAIVRYRAEAGELSGVGS